MLKSGVGSERRSEVVRMEKMVWLYLGASIDIIAGLEDISSLGNYTEGDKSSGVRTQYQSHG